MLILVLRQLLLDHSRTGKAVHISRDTLKSAEFRINSAARPYVGSITKMAAKTMPYVAPDIETQSKEKTVIN